VKEFFATGKMLPRWKVTGATATVRSAPWSCEPRQRIFAHWPPAKNLNLA